MPNSVAIAKAITPVLFHLENSLGDNTSPC